MWVRLQIYSSDKLVSASESFAFLKFKMITRSLYSN